MHDVKLMHVDQNTAEKQNIMESNNMSCENRNILEKILIMFAISTIIDIRISCEVSSKDYISIKQLSVKRGFARGEFKIYVVMGEAWYNENCIYLGSASRCNEASDFWKISIRLKNI